MKTAEVAAYLDDFLHLERFESDDFAVIIDFSNEAGIPIDQYATPGFLQRFNGLMLDNSPVIERAFTLVFPADDVLAEVERRADGVPSLIFTHHPMDMETSGRGLMPVSREWLDRLRAARISLYAAHAPLDCHETASTSRALARAIDVPAQHTFAGYFGGHAGVYGEIQPVSFDAFLDRVRSGLNLERVEHEPHADTVRRVAVVAGGAAYPGLMEEAIAAGCDTYVTGDYRVRHGGEWAEQNRPAFDAFVQQAPINLVGGSHYATESLVLKQDMLGVFNSLGLPAEFIPQQDEWR